MKIHPLADFVLYGDIKEMDLSVLGAVKTSPVDEEQRVRLQAAACIQAYFEGNLYPFRCRFPEGEHSPSDRLAP